MRADILDLTKRVQPYVGAEMDKDWSRFVTPAAVTVRFRDGRTMQARVDYPKGHPRNPMTTAEFAAKAADCARVAAVALPADTAERLIATVGLLETLPDLSTLMRVMTRGD